MRKRSDGVARPVQILLIFVSLFLLGCTFGLKTDISECRRTVIPGERMECLHYVALTYAYLNRINDALSACDEIWGTVGAPHSEDDIGKRAESERNLCYYDVAKIARDKSICQGINDMLTYKVAVGGTAVTRDVCENQAGRLEQLDPDKYYAPGNSNLCTIVFVLPMLVVYLLRR